jgi:hypothetical protein
MLSRHLASATIAPALVALVALAAPAYAQEAWTAVGEAVPADEAAATAEVARIIKETVRAAFEADPELARRDAHAKAHGCVKARFDVNESLPELLQTEVMQPGASYPAWIRYSNGSGKSQDDAEGDGRGMAIKLMDVPGEKLEAGEKSTQDFLMINHPVFFVRNVKDYVEFSNALAAGNPLPFFFPSVFPHKWRLHEVSVARAIQGKDVRNPLGVQYFSMTPYRWGKRAVKFSAKPCSANLNVGPNSSPDFLREALASTLAKRSACFEFLVQAQPKPAALPIEDPTLDWSESVAPFVKVATITIQKQTFTAPEQQAFCEHLSLNPWHATAEHRPLGGINRARRVVYQTISDLRHELNGVSQQEPTADGSF